MTHIYHITQGEAWAKAQLAGVYRADSLASEGFIHCSGQDQVIASANRFFAGQAGLVILEIDQARVKPEVRYEAGLPGGELFPHMYGPLNLDAVVTTWPLEPRADGTFAGPWQTE